MKLLRRHRLKVGAVTLAAGGLIAALVVPALSASSQSASRLPLRFVSTPTDRQKLLGKSRRRAARDPAANSPTGLVIPEKT